MATRYMAAGNETSVKLFPGAPHGKASKSTRLLSCSDIKIGFATMMNEQSEELIADIVSFMAQLHSKS